MDRTLFTPGWWLVASITILGGTVLVVRPVFVVVFGLSPRKADSSRRFEAVVAAVLAYGFYVAAALMAGAEFPAFMRDHLFDGLAPAALAGLLVGAFPRENPDDALPRIRRPIWILALFAAGGALIFGLIGAAGVFVAGSNDFWPVAWCAVFAGYLFAYGYWLLISSRGFSSGQQKRTFMWWFTKRSESTADSAPTETNQETGAATPT